MIRALLVKLGIVDPPDPAQVEVRSEAMTANDEARREIHDSRERRAVLQLRLEHMTRRGQHR